jgi:F0F1-type ATP synthase assembly protein I
MSEEADLSDKRDLYNGFGDGLAKAFEFAVTPVIFGVAGYVLDRVIGTVPLFTIVLVLVCIVGMFIKTWYTYDAEMKAHESRSAWKAVSPKAVSPKPGMLNLPSESDR